MTDIIQECVFYAAPAPGDLARSRAAPGRYFGPKKVDDDETEGAAPGAAETPAEQWRCPQCTLLNAMSAATCGACNGARPPAKELAAAAPKKAVPGSSDDVRPATFLVRFRRVKAATDEVEVRAGDPTSAAICLSAALEHIICEILEGAINICYEERDPDSDEDIGSGTEVENAAGILVEDEEQPPPPVGSRLEIDVQGNIFYCELTGHEEDGEVFLRTQAGEMMNVFLEDYQEIFY